ncbi:MAG: manganese efflux pump family protein [Chloroflexota bacterium]|nr:manganese efflux pump family protein [Chloroflexota bacterium]
MPARGGRIAIDRLCPNRIYTGASRTHDQNVSMNIFETLLMAVGLAMDCFAVALCIGTTGYVSGRRPLFRLAFHFGLFQALMPVLGWLVGTQITGLVSAFDHWLAFGLLGFVGIRMIRSGQAPDGESYSTDPSRGSSLILLSIATSIDAFAIGLTLAMLQTQIFFPVLVIGLVAGGLSLAGLKIGCRLGENFGKRMEIIGGIILILIGLRVLLSHAL